MNSQVRKADMLTRLNFNRSERIFNDGLNYYFKIRNGSTSEAFETYSEVLFEMQNYIDAVSIEEELQQQNYSFESTVELR